MVPSNFANNNIIFRSMIRIPLNRTYLPIFYCKNFNSIAIFVECSKNRKNYYKKIKNFTLNVLIELVFINL